MAYEVTAENVLRTMIKLVPTFRISKGYKNLSYRTFKLNERHSFFVRDMHECEKIQISNLKNCGPKRETIFSVHEMHKRIGLLLELKLLWVWYLKFSASLTVASNLTNFWRTLLAHSAYDFHSNRIRIMESSCTLQVWHTVPFFDAYWEEMLQMLNPDVRLLLYLMNSDALGE